MALLEGFLFWISAIRRERPAGGTATVDAVNEGVAEREGRQYIDGCDVEEGKYD